MAKLSIERVYEIVKGAHERMGWRPNGGTSREQRNAWFEAAVAAVHYGHPVLNPDGGDQNWCIKNAGGGRPQSDDIVVYAPTREYYDLIGGTGTDTYRWGIGRHSDTLPGNQEVYAPREQTLLLFDGLVVDRPQPPGQPTEPPPVQPSPQPPGIDLGMVLQHIWARLDELQATVAAVQKQLRSVNDQQHAFTDQIKGKVAEERDFLHNRLNEQTATLKAAIGAIDADVKCALRRR